MLVDYVWLFCVCSWHWLIGGVTHLVAVQCFFWQTKVGLCVFTQTHTQPCLKRSWTCEESTLLWCQTGNVHRNGECQNMDSRNLVPRDPMNIDAWRFDADGVYGFWFLFQPHTPTHTHTQPHTHTHHNQRPNPHARTHTNNLHHSHQSPTRPTPNVVGGPSQISRWRCSHDPDHGLHLFRCCCELGLVLLKTEFKGCVEGCRH